jgi:hypothetical protein
VHYSTHPHTPQGGTEVHVGVHALLSTIAPRLCLLSRSNSCIRAVVHCSTFAHPWARSSAIVPDIALDNCSCIVLPSPFRGLVPPPSLESSCIHAVEPSTPQGGTEKSP